MEPSVREHGQKQPSRMGIDTLGLPSHWIHHPHLHLLLEWAEDPREVEICTNPGQR